MKGDIIKLKKESGRFRGSQVEMMGNWDKLLKNQSNMTTQLKNLTATENSMYSKNEGA